MGGIVEGIVDSRVNWHLITGYNEGEKELPLNQRSIEKMSLVIECILMCYMIFNELPKYFHPVFVDENFV